MSATTLAMLAERIDNAADNDLRRRIDDTLDPFRQLIGQWQVGGIIPAGSELSIAELTTRVADYVHAARRAAHRAEAMQRFIERADRPDRADRIR